MAIQSTSVQMNHHLSAYILSMIQQLHLEREMNFFQPPNSSTSASSSTMVCCTWGMIEPNEHEASQQAWWLFEDLVRDVSETLSYKGCRWYLPLPKR